MLCFEVHAWLLRRDMNGHVLLERWEVSVDGYAAEVVNEREMF